MWIPVRIPEEIIIFSEKKCRLKEFLKQSIKELLMSEINQPKAENLNNAVILLHSWRHFQRNPWKNFLFHQKGHARKIPEAIPGGISKGIDGDLPKRVLKESQNTHSKSLDYFNESEAKFPNECTHTTCHKYRLTKILQQYRTVCGIKESWAKNHARIIQKTLLRK